MLAKKLLYLFAGLVLGALGLLVVGLGILGIIDPAGAKMSDDSDPFGPTTGIVAQSVVITIFGAVFLIVSIFLLWRIDKSE